VKAHKEEVDMVQAHTEEEGVTSMSMSSITTTPPTSRVLVAQA